MSDIVFILGAGASKLSGAPLMFEFLDTAADLLRRGKVGDQKASFDRIFGVLSELQAVHSKASLDLNNIESVFTALELGRVIKKVPGLADVSEIERSIADLKTLIYRTLEATQSFPTKQGHIFAPAPYEKLAALIDDLQQKGAPRQSCSVISFNYDVGVDIALVRAGVWPHYVIDGAANPGGNSVDLLKLHGSLNWAQEEGSDRILPLHPSDYVQRYRNQSFQESGSAFVPIGSQLKKDFDDKNINVKAEPVLVPPSWNKADYHHTLSDVWAAAARHLSEAEQILVIGYSLPETDSFFRHLYALGSVGRTRLRRFSVFNPDRTGGTEERFRRLLGPGAEARFSYHPEVFEEALRTIRQFFQFDRR